MQTPPKQAVSEPIQHPTWHERLAFLRRKQFWIRLAMGLAAFILLITSTMYGIALWYQHKQAGKPYELGVTFIPAYASYLGVDPHETLDAIINDLGVRKFRLVSYWNEIEQKQGAYDFSNLDWQMAEAEKAGASVSLAIGLRQPRWPECHAPDWVDTSQPTNQWQPALEAYMTAVINRYKDSPSLSSYQLENEFFNTFGDCDNFDRQRLSDELALVHKLDPHHPVIISRSNNYAGLPLRDPLPDVHGISIYRKVYSPWVKGYFTYPFPSWYYAFLAGAQELTSDKPSVIHELQTEPWPANGQGITEVSLDEQNKTFDAAQLQANVAFAKQTGIRSIDLWGAEYWYYRWQVLDDDSVWQTARTIFSE